MGTEPDYGLNHENFDSSLKIDRSEKGKRSGNELRQFGHKICPEYSRAKQTHAENCERLRMIEKTVGDLTEVIAKEMQELNTVEHGNTNSRTRKTPKIVKRNNESDGSDRPAWFGDPF